MKEFFQILSTSNNILNAFLINFLAFSLSPFYISNSPRLLHENAISIC